jgi:predicted sulfurtransferase
MYCTGGIRCDVYSTFLRQQGFQNLYTLEGGIQNYLEEEGSDHWNGSLYVFDDRMAVAPSHLRLSREGGKAASYSDTGDQELSESDTATSVSDSEDRDAVRSHEDKCVNP